jgi:hypothetical protein
MRHSFFALRVAAVLAAGASVFGWADSAHADHEGSYANASTYSLKLTHMPDFDQRRKAAPGFVGLPNDGGMHCVPTSHMNLLAYAANHGFPNLAPGPAWWQPQSLYNDAGNNILLLGILMLTNEGTALDNAHNGMTVWLSGSGLTTSAYWSTITQSPNITNIAQSVATGGIVAFCYGRYDYFGEIGGVDFIGAYTGGHCVTFSEASRSGDLISLKSRDPADDPDFDENDDSYLFSQSAFGNRAYNNVKQRPVSNFIHTKTMTALGYPPAKPSDPEDPWIIRLIDGYVVVRPMMGFTWQPGINNNPPQIFLPGLPLNGSLQGPQIIHELPAFLIINDLAFSADLGLGFVLGSNQAGQLSLQSVDLANGETTQIVPIDGAMAMTVGRKLEIYVLTENSVICINPSDPIDPVEAEVFLPGPCNAICYDDVNDEVLLLSPDQGKIFKYPHRFQDGAKPHEVCIPNDIPLEPDEGCIAVNPMDGKAWFATPASNAIYHVPNVATCDVFETIQFPQITNPRSLSFDDKGHLFVACDAGLMEVMYNDEAGDWEIVPNSYFPDDVQVGPKFLVSTSRTNFDPEEHGPRQRFQVEAQLERIVPDTTLETDCFADLVSSTTFQPPPDGVVDAADLAFLLGAWGNANGSTADIVTSATFQPPEDGVIDAADLAFLLGAWGECP